MEINKYLLYKLITMSEILELIKLLFHPTDNLTVKFKSDNNTVQCFRKKIITKKKE